MSDRHQRLSIEAIRSVLLERGIDPEIHPDLPIRGEIADSELLQALAGHLFSPNAGHLHEGLAELSVGGRFMCGGEEWLVTDIGRRTLAAINITEEVRYDPSLLSGPTFALAETVFDADDFPVMEPK